MRKRIRQTATGYFSSTGMMFFTALFGVVLVTGNCSSEDTQFYEPEEANRVIASALWARDQDCGGNHTMSLPVIKRARKSDVDGCAVQIQSIKCDAWQGSFQMPPICLAIQVDL